MPIEQELTARWFFKTGDQAQRGGLTAAGGSDQREELPAANRERNTIHRAMSGEMFTKGPQFQDGLHFY